MNKELYNCTEYRNKKRKTKSTLGSAQIIFGEKTTFISFSRRASLPSVIKQSIIGLASSLQPKYREVSEKEVDLSEYSEFLFYAEDFAGRKIFLNSRESEFPSLLRFFSYRITIHVYITGSVEEPSIYTG